MKHAEERKETGLEKPRSLLEACEILGNCKNFQVTSKEFFLCWSRNLSPLDTYLHYRVFGDSPLAHPHPASRRIGHPRKYITIYRGSGFLAIVWFGSSPTPSPHLPSASCLSFSDSCVSPVDWVVHTDGGEWGGGAQSYDDEKAWSSLNHSIFSGSPQTYCHTLPLVPNMNQLTT
jgi:hypothetical protein